MRVLLFSMPDSFEHTPPVAMRMPNGALASLAGNVDPHHEVAIADLVLVQRTVAATVARLVSTLAPDVVGLSIMTFQRTTAIEIIRLVRRLCAGRTAPVIVVGGYDPTLAPEAYEAPAAGVDVIVRGEGDVTFRELLRALEDRRPLDTIAGLSYRVSAQGDRSAGATDAFARTPPRPVGRLEAGEIRPPARGARVLGGYTMLGRPIDVVETSRGCTYDCSFCSIIEMRGRNFHPWPIDRVIADIDDARRRGARAIFLVDDNITLNVSRFLELCRAIRRANLHRVDYIVQAMTSAIAASGDELGRAMRDAGFRYVFLGIENVLDEDLRFLRASAKNAARQAGRTAGSAARRAIDVLHRHGMLVVGGLIVGSPGDTRESIEANLAFARRYIDWPYIQHPTPYPGTPMTRDFRDRRLIVNENVQEYDGTTAVVRTESLPADEVEYLRWRAERWMKLRHLPPVFAHDPSFVLRHGVAMLRHTFRGTRLKTWLRLESDREAFRRYREIRKKERDYVPRPAGEPAGGRAD